MELHSCIIMVLAIACYYNSLSCDLVFDDVVAIKENRDVRPYTPIRNLFYDDFWGTPLTREQSHKSYRPLTVLSFRFNYNVHQLGAFGYHLVNVILHCVVCVLYYRVCLLFISSKTSFVASALFATHPIHTEAVTSVVGRAELLSAFFYLSALWLYITRNRRSSGKVDTLFCFGVPIFSILGLLCKEQSVTVLAVCIVYELTTVKLGVTTFQNLTQLWSKMAGIPMLRLTTLSFVFAFIVWIRILIMGTSLPKFNRFDNPASLLETPARQLTYNYLSVVNFGLLLYPSHLCCDWSMGTIPILTSFREVRNVGTVALYCGLFLLIRSALKDTQYRRPLLMGIAMTVIPYIPSSNFLFPVGFVIAERTLYLPSMGFCILIAIGWSRILESGYHKTFFEWGLWTVIFIFAFRTVRRNCDWQTDFDLYSSALKINQNNAKIYNNMGRVLEGQGRFHEAINYYKNAIRIQEDDLRGFLNLGRLFVEMKKYQEAEKIFTEAKLLLQKELNLAKNTVTKSHVQVLFHLATLIAQNDSRLQEADDLYKQAINLKPDFSDAYLNRGNFLMKINNKKEAEEMYSTALKLDNNNPDVFTNLAAVFMQQGRNEQALNFLNKALDIQPDHEKALMNLATLVQETKSDQPQNAKTGRFEEILIQAKENEDVCFNLGILSLSKKDAKNAEKWFKKAIEKQPSMRSALFNLALLLSNNNRSMESLSYVKQLLKFHPNHVNGLILLADIYINSLNDLDSAEKCYSKVLEIEPNNLQGLHNLCVVHIQRMEYRRAIECFDHVSDLYPKVDYIQQHLEISKELLRNELSPK